jgi:hypothetical protein
MARTRKMLSPAVFLLLTMVSFAQTPSKSKPPGDGSVANRGRPCLFDGERGVVPDCIQEAADGKLFIASQYVKDLKFNSAGLAPVRSEEPPFGWMYVNRKGAVVITGVPTFDNWADDFSDGLVRTVAGGKYGFANSKGRIVITPAYDWASPFDHGYAEVCNQCREMCAMPGGAVEMQSVPGGCDHSVMVGGSWFKIDKKGRIVARLHR